ncbi:MAG: ATP-binding protein, partial [Bdellovibrionota bacterium]
MNYFRVQSALIAGLQSIPVEVECVQSRRLPYLSILGGGGNAASELRERVIAALGTLFGGKFRLPARRFTVQITPGVPNLPLEQLDLAVAMAILGSCGQISADRVENVLFYGRLGLDGSLARIGSGEAALRRILRSGGYDSAVLPLVGSEVLEEDQLKKGGGFRNLESVVQFLRGNELGIRANRSLESQAPPPGRVWSLIRGQERAKRLIEIAAAGKHHVLFQGAASARADLLSHALSTLLPPLRELEAEEVRGIYALAGIGHVQPSRPYYSFASSSGLPPLLGDRRLAGVEEVLLAHRGVLFVDQICEREKLLFPALEQPMRQGILQARMNERRVSIPLDLHVVASSALCACGAEGDPRLVCSCRSLEAKRYRARLRRLLRYPFDLSLMILPEAGDGAADAGPEWQAAADRVESARARMQRRQGDVNARLREGEVFGLMAWGEKALRLWGVVDKRAYGQS